MNFINTLSMQAIITDDSRKLFQLIIKYYINYIAYI